MRDTEKTKEQLIEELQELRRRDTERETLEKRQQVLSRVRDEIWRIHSSEDIEKVLTAVVESLRDLAVPFHTSAINLVDASTDPPSVFFCNLNQEGKWIQTRGEQGSEAIAFILRFWKDQAVVYRPDLEEEDLYGETKYIDMILEHHIRSVVDIPFSHGTLAVNSSEPRAFTEQHIKDLQALAGVLSEGYQRLEDIQRLERRNQKLEREIGERRRAEEKLSEYQEQLEYLVEKRTEELSLTNDQLQQEVVERQQTEERIAASLEEKEVLLRELHHRVKNNLQIISSLLDLQANHIEDETALAVLRNSSHRVGSMGLIHERLYQSTDLVQIDLADFIRTLSEDLVRSYSIGPGAVSLEFELAETTLGIDAAISCGLIIDELVANSIKHAFPHHRKGTIGIGLHTDRDNQITLTVWDDSIGIPLERDSVQSGSLGLTLVTSLVKHLKGKIEISREGGTKAEIVFGRKA